MVASIQNSAPRAGLVAWWRQARALLLLLSLFHQLAEMHQMLHVVLADFSLEPEEAKALSLAKGGAAPPLRPLFIGSRPFQTEFGQQVVRGFLRRGIAVGLKLAMGEDQRFLPVAG